MTYDATVLDPRTLKDARDLLAREQMGQYADLLDDTLMALSFVARHPDELQDVALTLALATSPPAARTELYAYNLMARVPLKEIGRTRLELTEAGKKLARVLVQGVRSLSEGERQELRQQLDLSLRGAMDEYDISE